MGSLQGLSRWLAHFWSSKPRGGVVPRFGGIKSAIHGYPWVRAVKEKNRPLEKTTKNTEETGRWPFFPPSSIRKKRCREGWKKGLNFRKIWLWIQALKVDVSSSTFGSVWEIFGTDPPGMVGSNALRWTAYIFGRFFLGELLKPYFWSQQPQVQHQPTKFFLHTEGSSHLVRMLQGVSLPEECQNVDSDLSSLMPLISGDPSQLMIPVMKPRGWCPVWTEDMELAEKKKGKRATYLMVQGHRCIIHEYTYPYNMTNRSYDIWCIYGRYTYHTTYYIYAYHTDIYIYCVIFSHMKIIDSSTKQFSLHHSPRLMSHFFLHRRFFFNDVSLIVRWSNREVFFLQLTGDFWTKNLWGDDP